MIGDTGLAVDHLPVRRIPSNHLDSVTKVAPALHPLLPLSTVLRPLRFLLLIPRNLPLQARRLPQALAKVQVQVGCRLQVAAAA